MKSFLSLAWEIFKIFIVSLAIIVPIRYFLIQPFFVKGASMEPNYENGEYLVIDEISYRFREPQRGEVVIFHYPADPKEFFIKRIIGLPGETVRFENDKIIIINSVYPEGFALNESGYLKNILTSGGSAITLAGDEFFVMGDNRGASFDSRRWGPLPRKNIVGRVWVRAWPVTRAQIMEAPAY
jgi:signal peptidase I